MEGTNNLIYEWFLVNERRESFHIPSQDDNNPFSDAFHSLNSHNIDNMENTSSSHATVENNMLRDDNSIMDFSMNLEMDDIFSFKSCLEPHVNDSLNDFKAKNYERSMNQNDKIIMIGSNIDEIGDDETNLNVDLNTLNKTTVDSDNAKRTKFNVFETIQDAIKNGMKTHNIRAGRPKQEFDTSPYKVFKFYEDYKCNLERLIETNYSHKRSDTFRNTIFSYLKKLPIKLREMCCSVSEPKSKKLDIYLNAFLTAFVNCFIQYFNLDGLDTSKVELFLYFIWICYPEDKCIKIIKSLVAEKSLSEQKAEKIIATLSMRKGKSKKDITSFIISNPCFQAYSTQILSQVSHINFHEQASLMVKDFVIDPEK